MSRTFRKGTKRQRKRWFFATKDVGDLKPFEDRFTHRDGKGPYTCKCEYCVSGKLHKHKKRMEKFCYDRGCEEDVG